MAFTSTIQNEINTEVAAGKRVLVIEDLSGDAIIPENVDVTFYNCNIKNLNCLGNNNLFISGARGSIYEADKIENARLIIEDQKILYRFQNINGSHLEFRNCLFGDMVTAINSTVEARNCTWQKDPGVVAFCIEVTDGTLRVYNSACLGKYDMPFTVHRGRAEVYDTGMVAAKRGVWADEGSHAHVVNCIITANQFFAVEASQNSTASISNCPQLEGIQGCVGATGGSTITVSDSRLESKDEYGIYAIESSTVKASNCEIIWGKSKEGIYAYDDSRVEVVNCPEIKSDTLSGIKAELNSNVSLTDVGAIRSSVKDAIEVIDYSKVTCNMVPLVIGKTRGVNLDNSCQFSGMRISEIRGDDEGIYAQNYSTAIAHVSDIVESVGSHACYAKNYSKINLSGCDLVTGTGGSGVLLEDNSHTIISDCAIVEGLADDGITASNGCFITVANASTKIEGLQYGIKLSTESHATVNTATLIHGFSQDGVYTNQYSTFKGIAIGTILGDGPYGVYTNAFSSIDLQAVTTIEGVGSDGIKALQGATVKLKRIGSIVGQAEDGINASQADIDGVEISLIEGNGRNGVYVIDNCRVSLRKIVQIHGVITGYESLDSVNDVFDVGTIVGDALIGANILSGSELSCRKANSIIGTGNSGLVVSESSAKVSDIGTIQGLGNTGIIVTTEGTVELTKCNSVTGATNGIQVIQDSSFRARGLTTILTAPISMFINNNSYVWIHKTSFTKKLQIESDSKIELVKTEHGDKVEANSNSEIIASSVSFQLEVLLTSSKLNANNCTFTLSVEDLNGDVFIARSTVVGLVLLESSSCRLFKNTHLSNIGIDDGALNIDACLANTVTATDSKVEIGRSTTTAIVVTGCSLNHMRTTSATLTATGSGIFAAASTIGSISLTNSALYVAKTIGPVLANTSAVVSLKSDPVTLTASSVISGSSGSIDGVGSAIAAGTIVTTGGIDRITAGEPGSDPVIMESAVGNKVLVTSLGAKLQDTVGGFVKTESGTASASNPI